SEADVPFADGDVPTIRVERGLRPTQPPRMNAEAVEAEQSQAQSRGTPFTRGADVPTSPTGDHKGNKATPSRSLPPSLLQMDEDAWSSPSTPMPGVVGWSGSKSLTLPQRMKTWVTGKLPALKSVLGEEESIKQ